jgi:class 3 adenylate cyclase/pimeloyl-ACP methyl ester carboxylesterase
MEVPDIQFTKSGDVNIAYQRYGTGPDVVIIPPLTSNVEILWEHELWRRVLEFNGQHVRTLHFDKRGIGMSDRFEQHPTLEQRIGDINAVMDAEGIARASIMGLSEGGLMAQLFAARHPERVDRLVLINSAPGASAWSQLDQYTDEPVPQLDALLAKFMRLVETWGRDPAFFVEWFMPSQRENPSYLRWVARYQRQTATQADLRRQIESIFMLDAVEHLPNIKAPTRVIKVTGDRVIPVAAGRFLAAKIPGAEYVEVGGEDHLCWIMPHWRKVMDCWLEFVTGTLPTARSVRRFATVLFTDIVGSTERAHEVGDEAWRLTLESHDRIAWRTIEAHRGSVVKSTGDGLLVTFGSPSDAVACAAILRRELASIGVAIRGGLHAGEIAMRDDGDVSGLAVNLAARVAQAAQASSIYVSSTVHDLLLGGDQTFADRGEHALKGIEGSWRLYRLSE